VAFNTPGSAAENGFSGNREAINHASQVNQLLGTANTQVIYPGLSILANEPGGNGQHLNLTSAPPNYQDRSQPFTMPVGKTAISRITLPVQPQGNGSDLKFTLCPDDGSGSPNLNAPICSTVIPASWTNNITIQGSLTTDVPPLVTTQYNAVSLQNDFAFPWSQPAIGPGGAAQFATPTTDNLFMILSGGYTGSAAAGTVATVQSLGGGFIGNPTLQPSLPKPAWYHMMCTTSDSIMVVGGTDGINFFNNVWTASWDSDTGTIGAWTAQTNFPVVIVQGAATSWNDYVYVIGGNADGTAANSYSNVYYANAANGQIQSWTKTTSLPLGLQLQFAAAINGWIVVCGGQNSSGTTQNKTYYAKIDETDGTVGPWYTGQNMPVGCYALGAQWSFTATENAMVIFSGLTSPSTYTSACQTLPVMTNSIGTWWLQDSGVTGAFQVAAFPHGEPGNWQLNIIENTIYLGADTLVVPMLSVPLPATGLTAGNVYHVVMHNLNENLNDYTQYYVASTSTSGFSPYLIRVRYTNGAWTPQVNGFTFPITVYDNTPGGGQPIHLWQDPNGTLTNLENQAMSTSTYVYDFYGRLLGYCDAITEPRDPLNANTLVTSSVSSWTPTNATLVTTTAQVHNGYSNSGLLTPNGVSALAYVSSELIRITAGIPYTASSWFYMASLNNDLSLSVNWFDSTQTYLSTSSNSQSISAATWTLFKNVFTAPAGAAYAALVPTLGSTPSAGNPLYISFASFLQTDPSTLSSVAEMDYDGVHQWPPTGITQLN
jgi:hypothetical protein